MNQDNLDKMLEHELREEFTPPLSLDFAVKRKMDEAIDKKSYRFNIMLLIMSLSATLAGMIVLFPLIQSGALKAVFITMNISVMTFFALFFIINFKSKNQKGVLS